MAVSGAAWSGGRGPIVTAKRSPVSPSVSTRVRLYGVRCQSSQLRLSVGPGVSEKTQQNTLILVIRNVKNTGCDLRGYPIVTLVSRARIRLPFRYRRGGAHMLPHTHAQSMALPPL